MAILTYQHIASSVTQHHNIQCVEPLLSVTSVSVCLYTSSGNDDDGGGDDDETTKMGLPPHGRVLVRVLRLTPRHAARAPAPA